VPIPSTPDVITAIVVRETLPAFPIGSRCKDNNCFCQTRALQIPITTTWTEAAFKAAVGQHSSGIVAEWLNFQPS
jgi:hypothetical protein